MLVPRVAAALSERPSVFAPRVGPKLRSTNYLVFPEMCCETWWGADNWINRSSRPREWTQKGYLYPGELGLGADPCYWCYGPIDDEDRRRSSELGRARRLRRVLLARPGATQWLTAASVSGRGCDAPE
jgi:hypothetical protein